MCALALVTMLTATANAAAATFDVDRFTDAADSNAGDGVCQTADESGCSLRAAVQEANALGGAHTVRLPAGSTSAVSGEIVAGANVTIQGQAGARAVVQGDGTSVVLRTGDGATLTLDHIEVTGGRGGLINSHFATLHVVDSVIRNNTNSGASGGALNGSGTITFSRSTLRSNSAAFGGGIWLSGGTLTVDRTLFHGNSSTFRSHPSQPLGTTGAAINADFQFGNAPAINVTNSTFVGNSSAGGAAIRSDLGSVNVSHSTFSGNTGSAQVFLSKGTEDFADPPATATLVGNVIRHGTDAAAVACSVTSGATLSGSHNVIGDGTCAGITDGVNGNDTNVTDAEMALGNFGDYGGPTPTIPLLAGSIAIDHGAADCSPPLAADVDQRGFPRPNGSACDAGAFEVQPPPPTTTITSGPGSGTVTNDPAPLYGFSGSASAATYECRTLKVAPETIIPAWGECTSPYTAETGTDGQYVVDIRSLDGVGQPGGSAQRSFTLDTAAPDTSVEGPSGRIRDRTPSFTLASEGGDGFECSVDGGPFEPCSEAFTPMLGEGAHELAFRAVDAAGNRDDSPATAAITVDTTVGARVAAGALGFGRAIRVAVGCDVAEGPEGCAVQRVVLKTAKKVRVGDRRRKLVIGSTSGPVAVAPGEQGEVVVRVARRVRKALAKRLPLRAAITSRVTDEVGNAVTLRVKRKLLP